MKQLLEVDSRRNINLKRSLTKTEQWWIRNERSLCFADASYFKTRYCWLSDDENHTFRYAPRKSQLVFNSILADFDARALAIQVMCLKARQQGISTEVQLNFAHRAIFVPGTRAVSSSVDGQKSETMANMSRFLIKNLPWWLTPSFTRQRWSGQRGMIEFGTDSVISVQSGTQDTGIAQGTTVTCAHLSEVCDYQNPEMLIEEGLFRAMHPSAAILLVLESTGNGNVGWWPKTWRDAKEFFPLGRARLCPVFIPWHMADDLYPKSDWLKQFPIPDDFKPSKETRVHMAKCKAYVANTPMFEKMLGEGWELPRHQQWYWQMNYEEAARKDIPKSWLRQMPADDYEALAGKNDPVFGEESIASVETGRQRKYEVYGIVGEGIDEKHEPEVSLVDYDKPRIEIDWKTPRGILLEWMLVPLKPIDEHDEKSAMTKLLLYEPPLDGCDYSFGGDCADGIGGDRTVLCGNRIGVNEQPDIQAFEFCSDQVSTAEAAAFMACLAAWYGPCVPNYGKPLMGIEQTRKPGDDAQNQLIRMGFNRHYQWHRIDHKHADQQERRSLRIGWYTYSWSRDYMMGRGIDAVDGGWYKINSVFLKNEFGQLEKRRTSEDKSKIDHVKGKHNDRVFAAFIAYVIAHGKDILAERQKRRYSQPKSDLPELNLDDYNPFSFTVSGPGEELR